METWSILKKDFLVSFNKETEQFDISIGGMKGLYLVTSQIANRKSTIPTRQVCKEMKIKMLDRSISCDFQERAL